MARAVLVGAPIENAPLDVILVYVAGTILTTCYVAIVRCLETLTQWVHTVRSALQSEASAKRKQR